MPRYLYFFKKEGLSVKIEFQEHRANREIAVICLAILLLSVINFSSVCIFLCAGGFVAEERAHCAVNGE